MADEAKFHNPICSSFEALIVHYVASHHHGEVLGPSVHQCQPQALQILVHLIDLLSILLKCKPGFRQLQWIRWTADHQTVTMIFLGVSLALGNALELLLSPAIELVMTGYWIKSTFHCTSQSDQDMVHCCCIAKKKMTIQNDDFLKNQLLRPPLVQLFHLSNLLQTPNDCKMVNTEFFGNKQL